MDAINKAFAIYELFLESDELSVNDIFKHTNIPYPTAHRITSTLVKRGYLLQPEARGKYTVNPAKLLELVGIIRSKLSVRTVASTYLNDLSQTVNEAVFLAVRRGQVAINIDVVNRGRILNITPDTAALGLYHTGAGKIFLAYLSDKEFHSYIDSINMVPRTSYTITDKNELIKNLNDIRQEGVAFDDEENELGLRSVAAPIRDWEGKVVAAISVIGPTVRISKAKLIELAPIVKEYALRISQAMGLR